MPVLPFAADDCIRIRGARVHNLQNVDVDIPRDRLVVITGVSGSGKSSLAFDTLFAEGQRRFLESLSTYTRQFLSLLERPDVDRVDGLPPTVCVDQRTGAVSRRSTLATTTELYDYLRLLYARAGTAHCTACGRPVARQSSQAMVEQILAAGEGCRVMLLAPLVRGRKGKHREVFERIVREGFVRARVDGQIVDAAAPSALAAGKPHDIEAVVDRIKVKEGIRPRLQESVDLALKHGGGTCLACFETAGGGWRERLFSERFACPHCEQSFPDLEPRSFSFNSPYGACPQCHGLGTAGPHDPEGAGAACPACGGARLAPFPRGVTVAGVAMHQLAAKTVSEAAEFVEGLLGHGSDGESWGTPEAKLAAQHLLPDIAARLRFLRQVGLEYLTLDRPTRTLSGGEFGRSRLGACLGSGLIGVCYVLDEPTVGLHPRDSRRLLGTLQELRDRGNTVVVVEHDREIMQQADYVIDLGPGAGGEGGRVVAAGTPTELARCFDSPTGRYLAGSGTVCLASRTRPGALFENSGPKLRLSGARTHNLRNVTFEVPLGRFVCVTGVSGSGKTSLVMQTLVPAVRQALASGPGAATARESAGEYDALSGIEAIEQLVEVDRSPLGRSGRSTPATYCGAWDEVRRVFARTREARLRGYTARRFSFNSTPGRCDRCSGHGSLRLEMKFMPDVHVPCPACQGARFNRSTLAVRFRGFHAADVLAMRFDEAAPFFANFARLSGILQTFVRMGLGYLTLGQSSLTLSGGEAQRIKLATELCRAGHRRTLFVLDEPTTGLHPLDVSRLLDICRELTQAGNTLLVIEHNLDVVGAADWVVDLGPEGGAGGGEIVFAGPPELLAKCPHSHTGRSLQSGG